MRQVAAFYGYQEDRRHLCLCPFHRDKHPSMRIYPDDKGFYCFSCGKGGDVITFVGALYGLGNEDAARKLIEDFSLPIQTTGLSYAQVREREKRMRHRQQVEAFQKDAIRIVEKYLRLLYEASWTYDGPHFYDALQEIPVEEYRLQCLREDPEEYYADDKAVKKIGEIRDKIARWNGEAPSGPAVP